MSTSPSWKSWMAAAAMPIGNYPTATTTPKSVTDDTRHLIAQRLLQFDEPATIAADLRRQGIPSEAAQMEVAAAMAHPYLQAAKSVATKLKKREWTLGNYAKLDDDSLTSGIIERKHKLSHDEFLQNYYSTNRPVIITGMMDNWDALKKWTPDYLREKYGHLTVEIQANRNADRNYETNMQLLKRDMLFGEYLNMITSAGATNDMYMTAYNTSRNCETLKDMWNDIDGLPEYLDPDRPEKGFLWIGPAGTLTPLHHDLTNNFMAQVIGRKQIKLINANQTPYVYNHLHCYSQVDMTDIDYGRFPLMRKAKIIDLTLEPGEILFLPIGCWHYVKGLDISITMSFINFRFNNDFSSNYQTWNEI